MLDEKIISQATLPRQPKPAAPVSNVPQKSKSLTTRPQIQQPAFNTIAYKQLVTSEERPAIQNDEIPPALMVTSPAMRTTQLTHILNARTLYNGKSKSMNARKRGQNKQSFAHKRSGLDNFDFMIPLLQTPRSQWKASRLRNKEDPDEPRYRVALPASTTNVPVKDEHSVTNIIVQTKDRN